MIELVSPFFHFTCTPESLEWNLESSDKGPMRIQSQSTALRYSSGLRSNKSRLADWEFTGTEGPVETTSAQGIIRQAQLGFRSNRPELQGKVTFALAQDAPLFLWKVSLTNHGVTPVWIESIDLLDTHSLKIGHQPGKLAFYSNGWQSWSRSGVYGPGEAQPQTRLGRFQATQNQNPGTRYLHQEDHFSSDFFGILGDRYARIGILAGFLAQKEQFGSLEVQISPQVQIKMWANGDHARLDPGKNMSTDWAILMPIELDAPDPLGPYLQAVGKEHGLPEGSQVEIPTGWCSWYEFYQNISAEKIMQNLIALNHLSQELPVSMLQIDDGFERQPGDWSEFRPGFPNGVEPLVKEIRQCGYTPGLWLAPFIVHPDSHLITKHPEYLLRNRWGALVSAGFIWDRFTRALDLTQPGALDYACKAVQTATQDWGFAYLKLDFLYAAAMRGAYHDPTRTRAQVLRRGLEALREAAGEGTYLLGCGVPIGAAIGLFQAMRISTDVSGDWLPQYQKYRFSFEREPHIPSTRNALQNILERAPLHRRWWVNDPDCLILRPSARLTLAEVQTLATAIALTGGSLLLSDNLPALPEERLRIAKSLIPVLGQRPRILDWFDKVTPSKLRLDIAGSIGEWHLLAYINWSDEPKEWAFNLKDYDLPGGEYLARDFWQQRNLKTRNGELVYGSVPAHGVALISAREYMESQPQYLGSDLHISQGMEAGEWSPLPDGLELELNLPRKATGQVAIRLPRPPQQADQDGHPIPWLTAEPCDRSCYLFRVAFEGKAKLTIRY